jgi:hypothetical protein
METSAASYRVKEDTDYVRRKNRLKGAFLCCLRWKQARPFENIPRYAAFEIALDSVDLASMEAE